MLFAAMSFVLMFSGAGLLSAAQNGPKMERRGGGPGMGPGRMGPGPMGGLQQIARGLDLTEDQRAQIREILEANRDQIEQTRHNIRQARESLDANYPETAEALGNAHAEAALLRAQIHEQIKQLLMRRFDLVFKALDFVPTTILLVEPSFENPLFREINKETGIPVAHGIDVFEFLRGKKLCTEATL